jgi:hypothetical protein
MRAIILSQKESQKAFDFESDSTKTFTNSHLLIEELTRNLSLTALTVKGLNDSYLLEVNFQHFIEQLASKPTLISLELDSIEMSREKWDTLFSAIGSNSSLSTLHLRNSEIHTSYIPTFPNLKSLTVEGIFLPHFLSAYSQQFSSLVALTLIDTPLTASPVTFIRYLSTLPNFQSLVCKTTGLLIYNDMDDEVTEAIAQHLLLKSSPTLKHLTCAASIVSDRGASAIATALVTNTSLRALELSNCMIHNNGAASLFQALLKNSHLTSLDLSNHNKLLAHSSNWVGPEAGDSLAHVLAINISLQHLALRYTSIPSPQLVSIAHAITLNTTLVSLDLSENHIDEKSAAFGYMLCFNTSLTQVKLQHCNISPLHMAVLANALMVNSTLTSLDIRNNNLKTTGECLGKALKYNIYLQELNLASEPLELPHHYYLHINAIANKHPCLLSIEGYSLFRAERTNLFEKKMVNILEYLLTHKLNKELPNFHEFKYFAYLAQTTSLLDDFFEKYSEQLSARSVELLSDFLINHRYLHPFHYFPLKGICNTWHDVKYQPSFLEKALDNFLGCPPIQAIAGCLMSTIAPFTRDSLLEPYIPMEEDFREEEPALSPIALLPPEIWEKIIEYTEGVSNL